MALVLCTGANPVLMQTRKIILERAGHRVIPATTESGISTACQQNAFEVAVIGQALSPAAKRHVLSVVRKYCHSIKILELYTVSAGKSLEDADAWLEAPILIPQELGERVNALVSQN